MTNDDFEQALSELESAEDFLVHFGVAFDPAVVQVHRLHILQRFHDYLAQAGVMPADVEERWRLYAGLLAGAYADFVRSDARTEKVFRVFRRDQRRTVRVALSDLSGQRRDAT